MVILPFIIFLPPTPPPSKAKQISEQEVCSPSFDITGPQTDNLASKL